MKKLFFTIFVLLGVLLNVLAQDHISKQEAIEDIDYFFNNAELIHPDLYFKISKTELSNHIQLLENKIKDSISVNDFSKKMRALVNKIGDGHTNVGFSDELYDAYTNATCRIPFQVKFNEEKLFVSISKTEELMAGDEILSINNIEAKKFLALNKYPIVDMESQRNKQLEQSFSYFLFMEYGFTEKVNLRVKRNGAVLKKEIKLVQKVEKDPVPNYSYKTMNDSVGVLQVNSFYDLNTKAYKHFLDSTFNQVDSNNIKLLIIDLRNNGGGNTYYGTILLPYVNVTNYKFTQKYQVKTSKPEKEFIRKNYISWYIRPLLLFSKMGRAYLYNKNGTITDFNLDEQQLDPVENAFQHDVCVLTSNDTYSAAADFVGAFNYVKRGLIVGDTVGQPYSGYIDKIMLTLPNSNLSGGVSFKKYEFVGTTESNKHEGIPPDLYIDMNSIETEAEIYQMVINEMHNTK